MAHPPRTGTQKALRITSIIMIIFGVLVALSGAIIIASGAAADSLGLNDAVNFRGTETTAGILTMAVGILVLIMGALQLIVAFLGLRASNDASKVGPYRALSWGISIVILAMIVYNWFLGGTFLDDPFLLIGDVVYLLVCTTLADVVKKEHDRGIVGEAKAEVERSGSQKALRVISIVLVVFAVISIVLGLAFLALIAAGLGTDAVNAMDPNDPDLVAGIAVGLVLGVVLVTGGKDGIRPLPSPLMKVLNFIVNILRSVPFLILMIIVIPLSRAIVGTSIGTVASIVPLVIASFPFVSRLVETSMREVDGGVIEAAQSMGATPLQIITKVMVPESMPSLVANVTIAATTIMGYGAMAGIIGGGGLGKIAINYGYYRFNVVLEFFATALLVVLVQILQTVGTKLAIKCDKRVQK